ncbi:hypothetical protein MKW94_023665 [Papaver nudicaule]|uniref:Phytocyanin domain-containing protein n=1 Tax=Papaver nudicaule TaxID=74823 RepID=A0AA41VXK6_PAPNU|nr:hypothetical protein [Papaver nudicaule]
MAAANKFLLGYVAAVLVFGLAVITCEAATTYTVGDISGWDISTDLDSWVQDKTFAVGDVLLFQYSSIHNVSEVPDKVSYDQCNTTRVIKTSNDGNTSIPLTTPGAHYFVCGNGLHCLGGMKIQVTAIGGANAPANAPQGSAVNGPSGLMPASKKNQPTLSASNVINGGSGYLVLGFLCVVGTVFSLISN